VCVCVCVCVERTHKKPTVAYQGVEGPQGQPRGGPTGIPFLGAHEWPACSYEEDPRFNMKAW